MIIKEKKITIASLHAESFNSMVWECNRSVLQQSIQCTSKKCRDSALISALKSADCNWMFGVEINWIYFDTLESSFSAKTIQFTSGLTLSVSA